MFRVLIEFFKKKKFIPSGKYRFKVIVIFIGLIWYSASGYLYFEIAKKPDLGWSDALWWTLVTMSTVGYGDYFPVTTPGRFLVGVPTMLFGIGFLGFIISETASRLIESRSRKLKGLAEVSMKNHILIVNYTGLEELLFLVKEIRADVKTQKKGICLVDETLDEIPAALSELEVEYVKGNPADEATLEKAGLPAASHAIILSRDRSNPHSDDQNLATTLIIEKMNPSVFSVVEVLDPRKIHQMELAGANSAVCMSDFRSNIIIQEIQDPGVKNIVRDLTSNEFGEQFYFIPVESMKEWNYRELALWGIENGYSVFGIVRDGKTSLICKPGFPLQKGDKAVVIGNRRIRSIKI